MNKNCIKLWSFGSIKWLFFKPENEIWKAQMPPLKHQFLSYLSWFTQTINVLRMVEGNWIEWNNDDHGWLWRKSMTKKSFCGYRRYCYHIEL